MWDKEGEYTPSTESPGSGCIGMTRHTSELRGILARVNKIYRCVASKQNCMSARECRRHTDGRTQPLAPVRTILNLQRCYLMRRCTPLAVALGVMVLTPAFASLTPVIYSVVCVQNQPADGCAWPIAGMVHL